jgi:uncharacterized protein YjiS (DUF1127 family)
MPDEPDLQRLLGNYQMLDPEQQDLVRQRVMHEARRMRAEALRDLWRRLWAWACRRAAVARLHALDDRMLKDIGLDRSGIEAAVRGQDSRRGMDRAPGGPCRPGGRRAA